MNALLLALLVTEGGAPPDAGVRRPWVDQLLAKVTAGTVDTESERDHVKPEDVLHLAKAYAATKSWREKTHLIEVLQDSMDPALTEVWWDALDVPDCGDDVCWEVRAIALAHLDGDLSRFSTYYDDRTRCRAALKKRLAERATRRKR
ncbi:MAG: hypothetical protein JNJ54_37350 [Myxococcaceae bacterium]|nr:hypothetical protein [Myxococcaceae bacterium]